MARKIFSGILMAVGFILSPLSWWNDLIVNIPLAYLGGSFAGLFNKAWFFPGMVLTYWLTNLLGFLLMHFGFIYMKKQRSFSKKEVVQTIIFSLGYTILMVGLVKLGVLKFPTEYFK